MTSKWTPGPWALKTGQKGRPSIYGNNECARIAQMSASTCQTGNLNLILAAPELYDALVRARMLVSAHAEYDSALPEIDAALSKARGENEKAEGEKS